MVPICSHLSHCLRAVPRHTEGGSENFMHYPGIHMDRGRRRCRGSSIRHRGTKRSQRRRKDRHPDRRVYSAVHESNVNMKGPQPFMFAMKRLNCRMGPQGMVEPHLLFGQLPWFLTRGARMKGSSESPRSGKHVSRLGVSAVSPTPTPPSAVPFPQQEKNSSPVRTMGAYTGNIYSDGKDPSVRLSCQEIRLSTR